MTSTSGTETRKRKRLSKNKKKTWRKTDIADVEEHLDDQRLQERTGFDQLKGLVAEKTDDQLFFVDTVVQLEKDEPVRKKKRVQKPLKCHALLEPDANIKPARVKHNVRQEGLHRRCSAVQDRVAKGVLTATERSARQQHTEATLRRSQRVKVDNNIPVVQKDLWAEEVKDPNLDDFYMKITKQRRLPPLRHHGVKTSTLPAVEIPHPGASYNPTFDDHQELLQKALDIELKKDKEEKRIQRSIDQTKKVTRYRAEAQWLTEMAAGLGDQAILTGGDSERDTGDLDQLSLNPPVRREDKKTNQQRRKERERKNKTKVAKEQKHNRIKRNQVFRLKSIKTEVKARLAAVETQQAKKAAVREEKKLRPRKLKYKYKEPELEIKLCDELSGSLRLLKPEGTLMEDRLRSFQRRNIVETRVRAKKKRTYKLKKYIRKSHKGDV